MWPIVAQLQIAGLSHPLTSYGLCAILGVLLGLAAIWRLAPWRDLPRFEAICAATLGIAFGLLGAKLFYLAVSLPRIAVEGLGPFLESGGFVFYGGLIGGLAAVASYLRACGLPFLAFADMATPALALGHALGRVGCFLFGCCYGAPTSLPWGVRFPDSPFFDGPADTPLHPVQLYEAGFELLLMAGALYLLSRWRSANRPRPGTVFLAWSASYAVFRFTIELALRGDDRGLGAGPLPPSALISLLLFAAALLCWRRAQAASSSRTNTDPSGDAERP
jgi:phosphatidylglycerol:prolipoprotein diacylglycerol transferase